MRRFVNGQYIEVSDEEIESYEPASEEPVPEPTQEERIAALEATLLDLVLGGDV